MGWGLAGFLLVGAWTGSPWWGVVGAVAAYLISVQFHPWTRCWKCKGNPKIWDGAEKNWRNCYACKGSGKRLRLLAIRRIME